MAYGRVRRVVFLAVAGVVALARRKFFQFVPLFQDCLLSVAASCAAIAHETVFRVWG